MARATLVDDPDKVREDGRHVDQRLASTAVRVYNDLPLEERERLMMAAQKIVNYQRMQGERFTIRDAMYLLLMMGICWVRCGGVVQK